MNHSQNRLLEASASDPALAQLCDEIIGRLQAGDSADTASLALEYPEHAEELQRILPALRALVDLGASSVRGRSHVGSSPSHGASDPTPRILGDYRILREVGRGGMGVVYEAEQRSLNRRVALKILPMAAAMDSRQLQRFRLEAHAAACLHHTHIVPVHAVGVERGVPFYAMQFIEGRNLAQLIAELRRLEGLDSAAEPALEPADLTTSTLAAALLAGRSVAGSGPESPTGEYRSVRAEPGPSTLSGPATPPPRDGRAPGSGSSTRDRTYIRAAARLGLEAAEALDHAHTRGILHRDIKPGNLLVDAEGRLWVTDFGLAQVQGDHRLTLTGDVLGTLRYMSPEQALAKRVVIDGRTDIYSLGVTLYELLTLRPALDGKDRAEILRRIADWEPPPPRGVNAAVPRDLETIVLKAMAKEPADRYATARDLADDLRLYLEDRPIHARRPSLLDWSAKWVKRHTAAVATAAVVVVLAAAGLAASTILIDRQRAEAVRQRNLARKAVDEMYTQFAEKILKDRGELDAVHREFLEKALAYYQMFSQERAADPEIQRAAARAAFRVGKVHHLLGRSDQALEAYLQSSTVYESLTREFPDRAEFKDGLAQTLREIGHQCIHLGRVGEARQAARRAIESLERRAAEHPGVSEYRKELAGGYGTMGLVMKENGRPSEAEENYRKAIDLNAKLAADFPREPDHWDRLARNEMNLGNVLYSVGRGQEGLRAYQRARDISEKLTGKYTQNPEYRGTLAGILNNLGVRLQDSAAREAEQLFRRCLELDESVVVRFPDRIQYRVQLADHHLNLGGLLVRTRQFREAEIHYRHAQEIYEKLATERPDVPDYRAGLEITYARTEWLNYKAGHIVEGFPLMRRALEIHEKLVADFPELPNHRERLAAEYSGFAWWLKEIGNLDDAEKAFRRGIEIGEALVALDPDAPNYRFRAGCEQNDLAILLESRGETREARRLYELGIAHQRTALEVDPKHPGCRGLLRKLRTSLSLLLLDEDPDRSIQEARCAQDLDPNNPFHQQTIAWAEYRRGNWRACIDILEKYDDPMREGDFFVAMAYWKLGDKVKARDFFERANTWLRGYEALWKPGVVPDLRLYRRVRTEAAGLLGLRESSDQGAPR